MSTEPRARAEEQMHRLVKHAYATVPYYTELFDKNKLKPEDIRTIADLKKIPVLTKQIVNENFDKLQQKRSARENVARDLRKQIEELRSQLARYAEALEEDLSGGREKVAARSREALTFEKGFSDVSTVLVNHLKGRPECRDLMNELVAQVVPKCSVTFTSIAGHANPALPCAAARTLASALPAGEVSRKKRRHAPSDQRLSSSNW